MKCTKFLANFLNRTSLNSRKNDFNCNIQNSRLRKNSKPESWFQNLTTTRGLITKWPPKFPKVYPSNPEGVRERSMVCLPCIYGLVSSTLPCFIYNVMLSCVTYIMGKYYYHNFHAVFIQMLRKPRRRFHLKRKPVLENLKVLHVSSRSCCVFTMYRNLCTLHLLLL